MNTNIGPHHSGEDRDYLVQHVRCFTVPDTERIERRKRTRHPTWAQRHAARDATTAEEAESEPVASVVQQQEGEEARTIKAIGAPYEGWCLVLDSETTTDTAQRLRFGFYEVHGLDRQARIKRYRKGKLTRASLDTLHSVGVFYDPDALAAEEIALIKRYADEHHLACLTRGEFVGLFYKWVVRYGALVIGHNLPFDLSRLATQWTEAAADYRGGFTLRLCDCLYDFSCFDHPPIRVKMLGKHKARIAFQKVKPLAKQGQAATQTQDGHARRIYTTRTIEGKFLDTATLGRALLGPGDPTLAGRGKRFGAKIQRATAETHGGVLTDTYLDYARQDVSATFALYQAERDLYRQHGVSKPMWEIYSEASLGKAYLRELGVPPFLKAHPEVPPEVHGYGMMAYYGGRSETHIRLRPNEVEYCDFKSQYPTVNAIMEIAGSLAGPHRDGSRRRRRCPRVARVAHS